MNYFNYFSEIEDCFIRRRGRHLLLSPLDWAMMEAWQERGIPLFIVLRGIESVFDAFDKKPGPRTIKGLMYCREEVEAQFTEWSAMQAGNSQPETGESGGEFDIEEIKRHLQKAANLLKSSTNAAIREDMLRAAERIEELGRSVSMDIEVVDESLNDIEKFLDNALLTNSDKRHLTAMEKTTAAELKPYKAGMEKEAYDATFRLVLLKKLRESENVPRLSLFYI